MPLREALLQLECEGLIGCEMGKGVSVLPLDLEEHNEIYPILDNLNAMALRLGGLPTPTVMKTLRSINQRIHDSVGNANQLFTLDRRWHELLLKHCPNRPLLEMNAQLNLLGRRYDLAFWREAGEVSVSHKQHGQILDALEEANLHRAAERLEQHWLSGIEPVAKWLECSIPVEPKKPVGLDSTYRPNQ